MKNALSLFLSIIIIIGFIIGTAYAFWSSYQTLPTKQTLLSASLIKPTITPTNPITPKPVTSTKIILPTHITPTASPNLPINTSSLPITTTTMPQNKTQANILTFTEQNLLIADQQTYIALPINLNPANPPPLIIYNHGSAQVISNNFTDPFMIKMQDYASYFTAKGYIFAASNQHGDNWGSQTALNDTNYLITWIKSHYLIQNKVHLIGHSMGGTTALYYALRNTSQVRSIVLLAPSINVKSWKAEHFAILQNIPIAIWHGYKDNNVSWKVSQQFVDKRQSWGAKTSLTLMEGINHWTVEKKSRQQVFEWLETL